MSPYGQCLKGLIEKNSISKAELCRALGISRPYLYSVFSGSTPPPTPNRQSRIVEILGLDNKEASVLYDLAAEERGDTPADIARFIEDPSFRREFREQYIYSGNTSEESKGYSFIPREPVGLKVPCCYQGGKQRVAKEIVDVMFAENPSINNGTHFYDLCCGSGAITVELINRGVSPNSITMLDKSSWGAFWRAIGEGVFELSAFEALLNHVPTDKRLVRQFATALARDAADDDYYSYIIMQSCSFGGKQIWHDGIKWNNAFFRDYWEPKEGSVRKSPANPMQPSPQTLLKRVAMLVENCLGVGAIKDDIDVILTLEIPENSIVYIDPPYRNATGYAFGFDVDKFVAELHAHTSAPIYVSEGVPLSNNAKHLAFGGAKGGISGNRRGKHQEWLSKIG